MEELGLYIASCRSLTQEDYDKLKPRIVKESEDNKHLEVFKIQRELNEKIANTYKGLVAYEYDDLVVFGGVFALVVKN